MTDIEKMLLEFQYSMKPEKIGEDVQEFVQSFELFLELIKDKEQISSMPPSELFDIILTLKDFSDNIKPFLIKYGIVPYLNSGGD